MQDEIQENKTLLEKISLKMSDVDKNAHNLKLAFEELCGTAASALTFLFFPYEHIVDAWNLFWKHRISKSGN